VSLAGAVLIVLAVVVMLARFGAAQPSAKHRKP
jgi:hypothetical protein